jgi:hypothetical protein
MMNGPEPLYRLKVVRERCKNNPEYTGYGCGVPPRIGTGELVTEYYGPYVRRHAATSMQGKETSTFVISTAIETCQPEWSVVTP